MIWEMLVGKAFVWGWQTTEIKFANICAQCALCVFTYLGLPQTRKIFEHRNFTHKKIDMKFSHITECN